MKAPFRALQFSYYSELAVLFGVAAFFIQYFSSQGVPTVTISNTLIDGQLCQVLSPRRDVVYYSKEHSENAQFASPYLNYSECISYISSQKVCEDSKRKDRLALLGVKNPNISIFADSGWLAFSPTNVIGLSTSLDVFYGVSSSFPRPDMTQPFYGSDQNWYIFNYANGTFSPNPGTPTSTLLHDRKSNQIYFPKAGAKDYDFSSSKEFSVTSDTINKLGKTIGRFFVVIVAVYDETVFAFRTGAQFGFLQSISLDKNSDLVIADGAYGMIRKVDHSNGYTTNLLDLGARNLLSVAASPSNDDIVYYSTTDNQVFKFEISTSVSTELGTTESFGDILWLAVDSAENVIVADQLFNKVWRILDATGLVEEIGTSGLFNKPRGVAVDGNDLIYIADYGNNDIKVIDTSAGGSVTGQASSGSPMLTTPVAVAVSHDGDFIYFLNWDLNYVVLIDTTTGHLSILGQSYSGWSFDTPAGIAVDSDTGSLYITDEGGITLRKISSNGAVTRMGTFAEPEYFTVDKGGTVSGFVKMDFGYVDVAGTCKNIEQDPSVVNCNVVSTRAFDVDRKQTVYFELIKYVRGVPNFCHDLLSFSFADLQLHQSDFPQPCGRVGYITDPFVYAVVNYSTTGVRVFQRWGMWQPSYGNDQNTMLYNDTATTFDTMVLDQDTTVISATVIPDATPRYLLLALKQLGIYVYVRYDMLILQYETIPFATPTHYMVTYSWGVCNGKVASTLIELTGTTSFANSCTEPNGMYYQAPNYYYPIPYSCLGISYDKLLTDCNEIATSMKTLVSDTCASSISKVCTTQYNSNPPFTCSINVYPSVLTVLSLTVSNTLALAGFFSALAALILKSIYKQYEPTEAEMALTSDDREVGDLLRESFTFSKKEDGVMLNESKSSQHGDIKPTKTSQQQQDDDDDDAPVVVVSAAPELQQQQVSTSYSSLASSEDDISVPRLNSRSNIAPQDVDIGVLLPSLIISQTLRTLDYVNPSHLLWSAGAPTDNNPSPLRSTELAPRAERTQMREKTEL